MIADRRNLCQNMGTQNHGVLFPELLNQFTHFDDLLRVQSHRGLIQYNDIRIPHDRLCKADALPISFGEIADQPLTHFLRVCQLHNLFCLCFSYLFIQTFQLCHEIQILPHRHLRIERRYLRQIPHAFFCLLRIGKNIVTVDLHLAARRAKVSCNHIHCRGFSGTIRSEKTIDFPRFHRKRQIIHRHMFPIFFDQMIDFNQNHFLLFPVSVSSLRKKCVQKGIIL